MKKKNKKPIKGIKAARRKAAPPWYSKIPTILELPFRKPDARGSLVVMAIANKLKMPIGSVVVLDSKQGAERANHWHKADSHVTYVVAGEMEYFERRDDGRVERWTFAAPDIAEADPERFDGSIFYTPPLREHTMRFTTDAICVVLANVHRTQKAYEADIRHVPSLAKEWDERFAPQRVLPTTPASEDEALDLVERSEPR